MYGIVRSLIATSKLPIGALYKLRVSGISTLRDLLRLPKSLNLLPDPVYRSIVVEEPLLIDMCYSSHIPMFCESSFWAEP